MSEEEISRAWFEGDVNALRHEIERLQEDNGELSHARQRYIVELEERDAEIERLREALRLTRTDLKMAIEEIDNELAAPRSEKGLPDADIAIGMELKIEDKVYLAPTRAPFGGLRWWFVCPLENRRVRKLYPPGLTAVTFGRGTLMSLPTSPNEKPSLTGPSGALASCA